MSNVTIQEEFTLPSLGKIYNKPFDPSVKLRSMTVAEEMKRLTSTDKPYKTMCDIIEACMETKIPVSVYDLCLGDYQYLLHKLRIVTYGSDYKFRARCPLCESFVDLELDLENQEIHEYDESYDKYKSLVLPTSGETVCLKSQTPRDLDNIENTKVKLKKQFPDLKDDLTLMLNIESIIETVNGQRLDPVSLREYVKNMPMRDSLAIQQYGTKLNTKVGIDTAIKEKCPECNSDINTTFRYTSEFFRPTYNE